MVLLAALTTPPASMTGTAGFACNAPPICALPRSGGEVSCACAVMVAWLEDVLRGCHVPAHLPSCNDVSASGGSPVENEVMTLPWLTNVPQSSTTVTSSGAGHAAATLKLSPNCVNTGISFAGVHPAARGAKTFACTALP